MINWLLRKLIGTKNEREVKRLRKFVEKINQKEKELDELSNKELVSLSRELFTKCPRMKS
jgi:preprotein translocase subunit SecA